MTTIYAPQAASALATITRKGAAVTFPDATGTAPVFDQTTETWTAGTLTDVTGRAVEIPGDPNTYQALSLVQSNPVTLLLAASGLTITPAPGMSFTWAGTAYTVRLVSPLAPDGTPVIYTVVGAV